MKNRYNFNIYECFDREGEPVKFVCDGHMDSDAFREKCLKDFMVKPKVVQHRWRRARKFLERDPDRKYARAYTASTNCPEWHPEATPETVGLLK